MMQVINEERKKYLSNMIDDIFDVMLEHDAETPSPVDWSNKDLFASIYIFNHIAFNKIWDNQQASKINQHFREKRAQEFGELLRALVKEYTNIDTHELAKEV